MMVLFVEFIQCFVDAALEFPEIGMIPSIECGFLDDFPDPFDQV